MLGTMIFVSAFSLAMFVGLVWCIMWAANRWIGNKTAVAVGALAIVFLLQNVVRGAIQCAQPPRYVPPAPGSDDDGAMIFNCDAAGGALDRIYIYFLGPLAVLALCKLIWKILKNNDTQPEPS